MRKKDWQSWIAMVGLVTMGNDDRDYVCWWLVLKFLETNFPITQKSHIILIRHQNLLDAIKILILSPTWRNFYGISYTLKSPTPQFKSHLIVDYITNARNLVQFTSKSHIISIRKIWAFVIFILLLWP